MDHHFVLVHKNSKKELYQYLAMLAEAWQAGNKIHLVETCHLPMSMILPRKVLLFYQMSPPKKENPRMRES